MLTSLRSIRARLWTRDLRDHAPAPRPKTTLRVERLDDRIVPAINVVPTSQAGIHLRDSQVVNAGAGATIVLAPGDYTGADYIHPSNSGTSAAPITYQAANPANPPVLKAPSGRTAIILSNHSWIVLDHINADGQGDYFNTKIDSWLLMANSDHNIIRNCNFKDSKGYAGVSVNGDYNQFLNNVIDRCGTLNNGEPDIINGKDNDITTGNMFILAGNSTGNLVQGNTMTRAGHDLFESEGSGNVIRNNTFNNGWTATTGYRAVSLVARNSTNGRNLFVDNIITGTRQAIDQQHLDPPAMKVEGIGQIVRNNYIFDNGYDVIDTAIQGPILHSKNNHIFNNTITNNGGTVWWVHDFGGHTGELSGNVFRNNLLYDNRQNASGTSPANSDFNFGTSGSDTNVLETNLIANNSILKTAAGDAYAYTDVDGGRKSIPTYELSNPTNFKNNLIVNPQFVTPTGARDTKPEFALAVGSPLINPQTTNTFLTTTVNASGTNVTSVQVQDAGYFFARIANAGVIIAPGDLVKIGTNAPVEVVSISGNTLTLASGVSWSSGAANVSLTYNGANPDIGARESGATTNTAPTVNAGADQTITLPATASLNGTATDDGLPTGTLTTTWTKFSGPGTVAFGNASAKSTTATFSVSGTYVLRLTASDGTLTSTDDLTVTVNPAAAVPAAPTGLTATAAVTRTQVNLAWTDNATNETGFKVEQSTDGGATFTQIATLGVNVTSYSSTGLTPGTTYSYRVRANNGTLNSSYSNTASATTPTAPNAPTNLTAAVASGSAIDLAWTDNADNETGFQIERSTDGVNFTPIATVAANVTTFSSTGLTAGTTYTYRVRATNATGNSAYSNTIAATTLTAVTSTFEAETLPVAASSGDVTQTVANASASGGNFLLYKATAAGDFITLTVTVAQAGTYNLKAVLAKNNFRGITQLSVDGVNVGSPVDGYAAALTFANVTLASGVSLTAGAHAFKFAVTGKNAASSDFQIALDTLSLFAVTTYEAEDLSVADSSRDFLEERTHVDASGGLFVRYNANAVGDFVTFNVTVTQDGVYDVSGISALYQDRGITQLSVDGTAVGSPIDFYQAGTSFAFADFVFATGVSLTAGTHQFKFAITGKNPASNNFAFVLDTLTLTQTA